MGRKKKYRKKKNQEPVSARYVLEKLSNTTQNNLKVCQVAVLAINTTIYKENYSMSKHVKNFIRGYDLLQYTIAVRPFIMKKHNIKEQIELEILLYLFPIQFFSSSDFRHIPYTRQGYGVKRLVELGYLEIAVPKEKRSLYTLTSRAVKIVKEYYEYLSGEKKISTDSYITNPFKRKDAGKMNKIREKLMIKLKKQAERNPERFKKYTVDED